MTDEQLREMAKFTKSYYAKVYEKGVLFSVCCTGSTFRVRNTGSDFGKNDSDIPDGFYLGNKLWLPRRVLNERDLLHNKARRAVSRQAHNFPITGIHFIPHDLVLGVEEELEGYVEDLKAWRENTLAHLEEYKQEMLAEAERCSESFPEYKVALEKTYKDLKPLEAFETSISWTKFQITMPKDFGEIDTLTAMLRSKELSAAEADAGRIRESARERIQREMQSQVDQLDKFVKDTEASLRGAFVEHFTKFHDKLAGEGKDLSKANLTKIRSLIGEFRSLDFIGLDDVNSALSQIETVIGDVDKVNAGSSRDRDLRQAFQSALDVATTETNKALSMRPAGGRMLSL